MAQESNNLGASFDASLLLDLTQQLVEIPSVSRDETQIADFVESQLAGIEHLTTERIGNNLVARTNSDKESNKNRRLLIGGHLDTVPHSPEFVVSRTKDILSGPGVVDMKGGLAIMLALTQQPPQDMNLSFLFYASEEVERQYSGLLELEEKRPDLLQANSAILMEPTGGVIEAGCQGTMKVLLRLKGKRAHTARAWKGVNAIHRLAPILSAINDYTPRCEIIDGCEFIEAIQVVSIEGGSGRKCCTR